MITISLSQTKALVWLRQVCRDIYSLFIKVNFFLKYNLIIPAGSQHSPMYSLSRAHKEVTPLLELFCPWWDLFNMSWPNGWMNCFSWTLICFPLVFLTHFSFPALLEIPVEVEINLALTFWMYWLNRRKSHSLPLCTEKPTFTGLYTNWNSFITKSYKINLISNLVHH